MIKGCRFLLHSITSRRAFWSNEEYKTHIKSVSRKSEPELMKIDLKGGMNNDICTLYALGIPYGGAFDILSYIKLLEDIKTQAVFVQLDPMPYVFRSRKAITHVQSLSNEQMNEISPIEPMETRITYTILDLFLNATEHANPEENLVTLLEEFRESLKMEAGNRELKIEGELFPEQRFVKLLKKAMEVGIRSPSTPNPGLHAHLQTSLTLGIPSFLCDISELFFREILLRTHSLPSLQSMARGVFMECANTGVSGVQGFGYVYPEVYLKHRDIYMLAFLGHIVKQFTACNLLLVVSLPHLEPLVQYAQDYLLGMEFSRATLTPEQEEKSPLHEIIEKQALLDVLFETKYWTQPFFHHHFPYLEMNPDIIPKEDYQEFQKIFLKSYTKYNRLKAYYMNNINKEGELQ